MGRQRCELCGMGEAPGATCVGKWGGCQPPCLRLGPLPHPEVPSAVLK